MPDFFKSLDWIKVTKELGFPIAVAGFVLWKLSAFVDVAVRTQERTADSVQEINVGISDLSSRHVEVKGAITENGQENRMILGKQTEVLERIDRGQDKLIDRIDGIKKPL